MGQKITIDMELRFVDNATGGAKSASKAINQIEKEAKEAGQELDNLAKKKAKPSVDSDTTKVDRKLSRIDATLKKLGFRKTKTTIDADDKVTAKITKALNKLGRFAGRKFKAFLELKDSDALRTLNAAVIGVSRDSVASHVRFAQKYELPFTLLSDPELQAIGAYGVWQEKKLYGKVSMGVVRTTFIIDEQGVIERVMPKVKPDTNAAEILAYLSGNG